MMKRFFVHLLNPLLNVVLTVVLSLLVLNFDWAFTLEFIVGFSILAMIINVLTFLFLYKKSSWKYFLSSIGLFLSIVLLYLVFKITMGVGGSQGDQGNIAEGLVLIVMFLIALIWLALGGFIGSILNKYFRKT